MHFSTYSLLLGGALLGGCTIHKDLLTTGEQDDADTGAQTEGPATDSGITTTSAVTDIDVDSETGPNTGTDTVPDTGNDADTDTDTGEDTDPGEDTDTGGDTDSPAPGDYSCVKLLGWSDGLIGVAQREVACDDCGSHNDYQIVLLNIDPDTNERTKFAEAEGSAVAMDMVVAADGSIFVGGHVYSYEDGDPEPGLVFKFSPAGQQLWKVESEDGYVVDLALRGEELLTVGGDAQLRARSQVDGAVLWEIAGLGDAEGVVVDSDDTLYVAGTSHFSAIPEFESTWYLRKYNADRTLAWEDIRQSNDNMDGLVRDEAGGVILSHYETGTQERTLHKFAPDGTELWVKGNPDLSGSLEQLIARPGGGVIGVGSKDGASTVALDPDAVTLWTDLHTPAGLVGQQNFAALAVDGQVLVSGCGIESGPAPGVEGWILRLTP